MNADSDGRIAESAERTDMIRVTGLILLVIGLSMASASAPCTAAEGYDLGKWGSPADL